MIRRALIGAAAFIVVLGYFLDRGIYLGSYTFSLAPDGTPLERAEVPGPWNEYNTAVVFRRCRYLFVTGIAERPAWGGEFAEREYQGAALNSKERMLFCKLFGS